MKKMQLFLLAALLIGVGSAFTTVKATQFTDAYGSENGLEWTAVNQADEGITFECNSGSQYCLYNTPNTSSPIGNDQSKQFHLK